jgi:hypothetical protein
MISTSIIEFISCTLRGESFGKRVRVRVIYKAKHVCDYAHKKDPNPATWKLWASLGTPAPLITRPGA